MESLIIQVSPRAERGKQNKKIRKNKRIPAIVYGKGQKNIAFSLDIRLAEKYSKKEFENKIFTFDSEDQNLKGLKVIKKSISRHKTSQQAIHMDFLSLDMTAPIRVYVEVRFKGTPKGVKEESGALNIILRKIEIECLPAEIPSFIEADVSNLSLNQNIHVSDISLPKNIKRITKGQMALCSVVPAKEEEEKKEPAETAGEAGTAPSETQPAVEEKKEAPAKPTAKRDKK